MHLTPKQLFCGVIWCKNFLIWLNPRIFMRCQNRVSNHGSWHKVRRAKRRWLSKSGLPFSTSAVAISPHKFFAGTPVPSQHISVFSNNVFYFVGFRNECWLRRLWNLLYRWRHEVGLHLDCKTVVFGRFRKAGSAISVMLECEARGRVRRENISVSHHPPSPFYTRSRPFVRIWSVTRVHNFQTFEQC